MKESKKIRKFLRKQGCLRWYKKFLRESAFPFGIIDDNPIEFISVSNNPFCLVGTGYEQKILDNLRRKWDYENVTRIAPYNCTAYFLITSKTTEDDEIAFLKRQHELKYTGGVIKGTGKERAACMVSDESYYRIHPRKLVTKTRKWSDISNAIKGLEKYI